MADLKQFECSICLELLCEPTRLPCSHTFCRRCLVGVLRDGQRKCALCRAPVPEDFDPVEVPLYEPMAQMMMRQCTIEYMQRIADVALEVAHLVQLRIGNRYELLSLFPRPRHQWTLEVELEPQPDSCMPRDATLPNLIQHIRFGLATACRVVSHGRTIIPETERNQVPPKYVEVQESPFQVTAVTPMACTIPIIVTWQDWVNQPPLRLEHSLDFRRDGGFWEQSIDLHASFSGAEPVAIGARRPLRPSRSHSLLPSVQDPAALDFGHHFPRAYHKENPQLTLQTAEMANADRDHVDAMNRFHARLAVLQDTHYSDNLRHSQDTARSSTESPSASEINVRVAYQLFHTENVLRALPFPLDTSSYNQYALPSGTDEINSTERRESGHQALRSDLGLGEVHYSPANAQFAFQQGVDHADDLNSTDEINSTERTEFDKINQSRQNKSTRLTAFWKEVSKNVPKLRTFRRST